MVTSRVEVQASGRFFRGPDSALNRHVNNGIKELVELGEERLAETLRPRPAGVFLSVSEAKPGQASTGNYRANLTTKVGNLNALITDGGVVYGPWLELGDSATRFRGYASFRRTGDWLGQQAEGVMRKHIHRFVQEMNT